MLCACRVESDDWAEDRGDFSDLYIPPAEHMTAEQRRQFQQLQDEVCYNSSYACTRAILS